MEPDEKFRAKAFRPSLRSAKAKGRQGVQQTFCFGPGISQSALNTIGLAALKNVPKLGTNQPLHGAVACACCDMPMTSC